LVNIGKENISLITDNDLNKEQIKEMLSFKKVSIMIAINNVTGELAPEENKVVEESLKRLVLFNIQASESMAEGGRFDKSRAIIKSIMDELNEDDLVGAIFFNDKVFSDSFIDAKILLGGALAKFAENINAL
jgi:hypothetical protein